MLQAIQYFLNQTGERTFNQIALRDSTLIYDKQKCKVNLAISLDNLLYNHSQVQ